MYSGPKQTRQLRPTRGFKALGNQYGGLCQASGYLLRFLTADSVGWRLGALEGSNPVFHFCKRILTPI